MTFALQDYDPLDTGKTKLKNHNVTPVVNGIIQGVILASYIFLLIPLTIYVGNVNEFSAAYIAIAISYLPFVVLIGGICGLVAMFLKTNPRQKFLTVIASLSLLCWVQGYITVWSYGHLDGRSIDWTLNPWQGWLDGSIWVGLLVLALFMTKHVGTGLMRLAIGVFLLQLIVAGATLISNPEFLHAESDQAADPSTLKEIYRFSSDKNVLHVLADGFQSDIFEELVTDGENGRRLTSALEGFTFFREHLGAFPYTHMSMPAILSGKIYKNHVPIAQHMDEAIGGDTFLSAAMDNGYEVDIVNPGGLLNTMYKRSRHTNLYPVPRSQDPSSLSEQTYESARLLDLALFRLTPHFLKRFVYNDQRWLVQALLPDSDYLGLTFFRHIAFIRDMTKNMTLDRSQPVYKFLHLTLSHRPMVTDENCKYAGQVLKTVRPTVKLQAGCALEELVKLLEQMKIAGIYDDALIILMADHGAWVLPKGLSGPVSDGGKSIEVLDPDMAALSLPLLAIKRPRDTAPFRISNALTWVPDTPATVSHILNLHGEFPGRNVFDIGEDEERQRRFYYYGYESSNWDSDYLLPIHETTVDGRAVVLDSWRAVGTYLPGGAVDLETETTVPTMIFNVP